MIQPRNRAKYESLVAATAAGQTTSAWCELTGTPRSTAANWQKLPAFREAVAACRAEFLDAAIGKLSGSVLLAASTMAELAQSAGDDRTRLQAAQAILRSLIEATQFSEVLEKFRQLEARVEEINARGGQGGGRLSA